LSLFVPESKAIKEQDIFSPSRQDRKEMPSPFGFKPGLKGFLGVLCVLCERRLWFCLVAISTAAPQGPCLPVPLEKNMEKDLLEEEDKKIRWLRFLVDLAQATLMQSNLTLREAFDIVDDTKRAALNLFPGKEQVYDLVYGPRFQRIIAERFLIPDGFAGRN